MHRVLNLGWSVALVVICGCSGVGATSSSEPATTSLPPPSALVQRLKEVDYCARMNALYNHGSMDSQLSIYFADKADEVEGVLNKLKKGKTVSTDEIQHALDTSDAKRIGGYPC